MVAMVKGGKPPSPLTHPSSPLYTQHRKFDIVEDSLFVLESHACTARGSGHGEGGEPSRAQVLRQGRGLCIWPDQDGVGRIRHECVQTQKLRRQDVVEDKPWENCIITGSRPGDMAEVMLHDPRNFFRKLTLAIVWFASSLDNVAVLH